MSTTVYEYLEESTWSQNSSVQVGGSGKGKATQAAPSIETAELALVPDAPIPPATTNYFDCYYTQHFPADDSIRNYKLEVDWMCPTKADSDNLQCIEMEARHIVHGGRQFAVACQLQFSGGHLRYWVHGKGWQPTTTPQGRLIPGKWYKVVLEGHRDDTTVFIDQITVDGVVTIVGANYPSWLDNWGASMRCSLQLDAGGGAKPCRTKIKHVRLTVTP